MTHRITAATVTNFKRIRDIHIEPEADRALLLIAGKNAQGKSSLLDALTAAIGGKRTAPADPVRHGADSATIKLELDNGLEITRTITPDGGSKLTVRDSHGPVRSPQSMLDTLIGERFLDPIAFLYLPPADQRRAVLSIVGGGQLTKLEESRERIFAQRTDLGRDHKRALAELELLPKVRPTEELIDVAALAAERAAIAEDQCKGEAAGHVALAAQRELELAIAEEDKAIAEIRRLEIALTEARKARESATARHADALIKVQTTSAERDKLAETWRTSLPRRERIDRDLANANEHNSRVAADVELGKRRAAAEAREHELRTKHDQADADIARIERRKQAVIAEAKLPVDDLGVAPDHITLRGMPLAQASGAERLRVALALAIAASPNLADIWIRDGALLDEDSLAIVEQHAIDTGHRVWIERVGTADNGAIVIQDGRVVS